MKQPKISEDLTKHAASIEPAPKKRYQQPVLRRFGSLHQMTQGSGNVNGDGGQGMMWPGGSDRSIKENIVRIGEHPLGIGLYLFDYKPEYRKVWGCGRQFGVMADEVQTVMPAAVSEHANGYKLVDYAMLGISRAN